jgi:hypothetical protein
MPPHKLCMKAAIAGNLQKKSFPTGSHHVQCESYLIEGHIMTIRVVCPNGHALKVEDSFAGKTGLCPACKAKVHIPQLNEGGMSEDAIMDILGPEVPQSEDPVEKKPVATPKRRTDSGSEYKKSCHSCKEEVASTTHICPHCHAYIANLRDF